jgi:hypothetical protein
MRSIRQSCVAFVLTLVLALSAFAGDIQLPSQTVAGEMSFPGETVAGDMLAPGVTADSVVEIALGFLLDVSSLV